MVDQVWLSLGTSYKPCSVQHNFYRLSIPQCPCFLLTQHLLQVGNSHLKRLYMFTPFHHAAHAMSSLTFSILFRDSRPTGHAPFGQHLFSGMQHFISKIIDAYC